MNRKRKITLALAGGLAISIVCLLLYLVFSDLSGWRDTVSRLASNAIGRKLTITGEFKADIGRVTSVTATDLKLANTEWGSEPHMASIDRVTLEIDLWSLVSGPIFLPTVKAEGIEALFETGPDGRSNWVLGGTAAEPDGAPVDLRIDHIDVADLRLRSLATSGNTVIDLFVSALHSDGDVNGFHQLSIDGVMSDTRLGLSGRMGPLGGLINTSEVALDLVGVVGSAEGRGQGTIRDLATLSDLDLEASATIPDFNDIAKLIGLPETDAGAIEFEAAATTDADLTEMAITITADVGTADITGTVDSLINPEVFRCDIDISGPDIRPIAALADINRLPHLPYSIGGHLRWSGFPIEVENLEIEVGENRLNADGRLGAPPLMTDTDFRFHGGGPNIAALAALGGVTLPPDRFTLDGQLVRTAEGLQIESVEASTGRSSLSVHGFLGDPPEYEGTELTFAAGGPNLAHFNSVVGADLPAETFEIRGRLADGGDVIVLSGVRSQVGRNTLSLDGRMTTEPGMVGTNLEFVADVPDLSALGESIGTEGLPKAPLHATGAVAFEANGTRWSSVEARVADLGIAVDGFIRSEPGLSGSRLRVDAGGADLSTLAPLLDDVSLPAETFRVAGDVEILDRGLGLRGIDFELGSAQGRIDGFVGAGPGYDGTDLRIEAGGPTLAIAQPMTLDVQLPDGEFDLLAEIAVLGGELQIESGTLAVDGNNLTVSGAIDPDRDYTGSVLDLAIEGRDFSSIGRIVSRILQQDWPDLPALDYAVNSSLTLEADSLRIGSLNATLGRARAEIDGHISRSPGFSGSELRMDIAGPDASLFRTVTGTEIPVAPFRLIGEISVSDRRSSFKDVRLRLGGFRAEIDGAVGPPPTFAGTDVTLDFGGPDLALIGDLSGVNGLPALPFRLAGRFEGDPQRFSAVDLSAELGTSDLSGEILVDLEDKPAVNCDLRSDRISVPELVPARDTNQGSHPGESSEPSKPPTKLLISDTPFDLAALAKFDLDLAWEIGEVALRLNQYRQVAISSHLVDGRLVVDRLEGVGSNGGRARFASILEPAALGYRFHGDMRLDDARINLSGETVDPNQYAPVNVQVEFDLSGETPHDMASSSNGRIAVAVAEGVVGSSIFDLVAADILATLLEALNPFAKEEPLTLLQCAVVAADFDNGVMTLTSAAIQTDKMTILGNGTIDFSTEDLKLDWVTKPRKGIGLSASTITNPYIRLGGTLADPALEMKPIEAIATTGVAVATAGLSILGKGLLDRITAEKKVCNQAMKEAEELFHPEPSTKRRGKK